MKHKHVWEFAFRQNSLFGDIWYDVQRCSGCHKYKRLVAESLEDVEN